MTAKAVTPKATDTARLSSQAALAAKPGCPAISRSIKYPPSRITLSSFQRRDPGSYLKQGAKLP